MLSELIRKLKYKKEHLMEKTINHGTPQSEKKDFKIRISKENEFYKVEISDYITLSDYIEEMKEIDKLGIESLIYNAVLWNSRKQRVNKGTYYIIYTGNQLYNILINGNTIEIDERIKQNDGVLQEKIIEINTNTNDYSFTLHNHDNTGNTFYTRFFSNSNFKFGKLELTEEEFINEMKSLISNLEQIDKINSIFDMEILKNIISIDVSEIKVNKKTL